MTDMDEEVLDGSRGDDPDEVVGRGAERPEPSDPDPGWTPDPHLPDEWRGIAAEIGRERRPRREDVHPYLLIRAAVGDRGARPTWPPTPSWESPDILLMPAEVKGPFDSTRLVTSPVAGRSYRVFVRIWNLGLVPAVGVHVKAWAINPGFFGTGNQHDPYYQQHLIGGVWTELGDRTRPGCTSVVELDRTWDVSEGDTSHQCLLAQVHCPLDVASGALFSNADRHVGQRNLTVMTGAMSPFMLVSTLAGLVPPGHRLDLVHAGTAVLPTLMGLTGGWLEDGEELQVVPADHVELGVATTKGRLLLTAFIRDDTPVMVPPHALSEFASHHRRGGCDDPLDGWEGQLDLDRLARAGAIVGEPLERQLPEALGVGLDLPADAPAGELARALGGRGRAVHPLRFTLVGPEGEHVGGYTVVLGAG